MSPEKFKLSKYQAATVALFSAVLTVYAGDAAATAITMGNVASTITGSFENVTKLITATAYLAGIAFAVGAIIKFKAHKDNAAQVPIGQPVGLLMVAAALLFLPSILGITGQTIFGTAASSAGYLGITF